VTSVRGTCSDTCAVAGVRLPRANGSATAPTVAKPETFQPAATSRLGLANREILSHQFALTALK
jgi:hypothetical protein